MMEKDRNQKVSDRLNDFIAAHRKAILAVLIVLVAAVIALCVALVLVQRSVETRFNALNDLEAQYATLSVMDKTSAEYEEAAADFKAAAEAVAADGLDSYTGAKAQYLLADLAFAEGEWDTAAAYYADIAAAQETEESRPDNASFRRIRSETFPVRFCRWFVLLGRLRRIPRDFPPDGISVSFR